MSRCFPYPPPGYSRNGATYEALIESIKLQKETDKAKAERKKQRREKKEKKEKEKRKDEEKGKSHKNTNEYPQDACKVLQSSVGSKEAHNKITEPSTELLEKSDLTEEHGQPISSSHKRSYSSDSTQNSNKRKRDDAIVPDGISGHGKPIKIRLLKKHQRPASSKETLCSNSGRTDPQKPCGADASLNTWKLSTYGKADPSVLCGSNSVNELGREERTSFSSGTRRTGVPATSGREVNAVQGNMSQTKSTSSFEKPGTKNNSSQGLHFVSRKQSPAPSAGRSVLLSRQLKHEIPSSNSNKLELPVPSRTKKSDVQVLHHSRRQSVPSCDRQVLPQDHLKREIPSLTLNVPLPAPSVSSRKNGVQGIASGSSGIAVVPTSHLKHDLDSNKTKSSAVTGKRPISETTKAEPSRYERKLQKMHSKYEKLIGCWVPPVLEAQLPVDDDEDWLSRSEKRVSSSSSRRDDVERCHESASASLWQPCARFLAEVDIHALPYTVPF